MTDLTPFVSNKNIAGIKLEDLTAPKLDTVEAAIINCRKVASLSQFFMAVAFYHIYRTGLYKETHSTVQEYIAHLQSHDVIDRRQAHRLIRIGENFELYRPQLQKAGFTPDGNTTKLYFLDQAAEKHGKTRGVNALMSMKMREFVDFATGGTPAPIDYTAPDLAMEVTGSAVRIDGRDVLRFRDVEKIIQAGEKPVLFGVQDNGEAQALRIYLKKIRQKK